MATIDKGYYFFWNGEFSQWYSSPFYDEKTKLNFNCCEQFMMYKKAEFFGDQDAMKLIMQTTDPKTQKKIGRSVVGYSDAKWNAVCELYVTYGNYLKFTQNDELLKFLYKTADLELVEASPFDAKWGIGLHETDPDILDTSKWGQNLLGKCIMAARTSIFNDPKYHIKSLNFQD